MRSLTRSIALAAPLVLAQAAQAQLAVSANDPIVTAGGVQAAERKVAAPGTLTVIDMKASPPKAIAELEVPGRAFGPPGSVAILPKANLVLITSAARADPDDPTKPIPDDRLSVIDISALKPGILKRLGLVRGGPDQPKVIATLRAGRGASGLGLNRAGSLALVANHGEGTVSIFAIDGTSVTAAGKVTVGDEKSAPNAVAFAPDGKTAFVTLGGAHKIVMLSVDGTRVQPTGRAIWAGLRPYGIDVAPSGEVAVVANAGMGGGDADTISVIDLTLSPPRVVGTYSVGPTPEGIKVSPDGKYVAVAVTNGSNQAPDSPFYRDNSVLQVWTRTGAQLVKTADLPIGKRCRGVTWSGNSRVLLVQCMADGEIIAVRYSGFTGRVLQKIGAIKVKGEPAGIATAPP